jgi:hypothetical protein
MPTTLEIGNLKVTNRQSIVNAFNNYFANIGPNVAKTIPVANTTPLQYMPKGRFPVLARSSSQLAASEHEHFHPITMLNR